MQIHVKLFATLQCNRFKENTLTVEAGITIKDILKMLDIPEEEAAIIFVNGKHAKFHDKLNDGDTLSIFPPIGGG